MNGLTNRITTSGFTYDTKGNMTANPQVASMVYDTANRLIEAGTQDYAYDYANKRIYKDAGSKEYLFYGADGQLMASYRRTTTSGSSYVWEENWKNVSFAGRLIQAQSKWVLTDRLGSVRWREDSGAVTYFPYGEGGPGNANGFATYFRDSQTGLNYADQRYHTAAYGRFLTPDPGPPAPEDPASWNRYSYTWADPVNMNDPDGRLPANVAFEGGFGCIAQGFGMPGGAIDASNPCAPGFVATYGGPHGSKSRLQQIAEIFAPLGGIIEDWSYANRYGTAFNVSLSPDLFSWMTASGTAVMTQPGVYVIGGVLVRIVVTGAAIAGSPVVMTLAGIAATATVGYLIYMAGRDLRQVRDAGRRVGREPGCRPARPGDDQRVHEVLPSMKSRGETVSFDEILDAWREVPCN